MKTSSFAKGFTLLELLIALSIFSVMAAIAYGGVRLVINGSQQLEQAADSLSSLQRTFLFLQQDLEQAVSRRIRDDFGFQEQAFICCEDGKLLHLTRGNIRGNMLGGADLKRVEYSLEEGQLERRVWSVLDRVQDSKSSRLRLLEKVQGIDIKILDYGDSEWQSSYTLESTSNNIELPRAVEVTITTERYGAITRLFLIGL
jgi:general secretion pathway protein J